MTRRYARVLVLLLVVCGVNLAGEYKVEWSSETEQKIWALEQAYLDDLVAGRLDSVQEYWHERFVGWPSHVPTPIGRGDGLKSLQALLAETTIVSAQLRPRASTVVENLVVVHYVAACELKDIHGESSHAKFRLTHTWLKTPAGWKIIGGMSAS